MASAAAAVLGGLSTGASFLANQQQAESREQANALRLQEAEDQQKQDDVNRTRQLNEITASQVAQMGASGFSLSSPSFTAISTDSFNQYAEDENAEALNLDFDKIGIAQSNQNAKNNEIWGDVGSAFNAAKSIYSGHFSTGGFGSQSWENTGRKSAEGDDFI